MYTPWWGLAFLAACSPARLPENSDSWYDLGAETWVNEPIEFTEDPYPASDAPVSSLFEDVLPVAPYKTAFAPGDGYEGSDCESVTDNNLPMQIEGVVTIHPRYYFKTSGCADDDEKFYGSFFIEDDTGGIFVLGDSKVAHFTVGNRVRINVRGARTPYGLNMVYAWDTVSIDHERGTVHYSIPDGPFTTSHIGMVQRVEGIVTSEMDTFGQFTVESEDGTSYAISLDSEINRRNYEYPVGTRLIATGPVLYSYSIYSIIIMSTGQITVLEES